MLENIALGMDVTDPVIVQRCEEAARAAVAHDFICGLEEGYATRVGPSGLRLSGGQRQRVAIARALVAAPPGAVLIMDEVCSWWLAGACLLVPCAYSIVAVSCIRRDRPFSSFLPEPTNRPPQPPCAHLTLPWDAMS